MCDFEDIDLYQVRPISRKDTDQEWIEDNSPEELEEEEIEAAKEDVWFT
jgi:hypothetical protein